jgi:hypothetical protein
MYPIDVSLTASPETLAQEYDLHRRKYITFYKESNCGNVKYLEGKCQ